MLLKDYLLLNLGRITAAEFRKWRGEMVARRKVEACRDLLAFWRPREAEGAFQPGQVVACPVVGFAGLKVNDPLKRLRDGLEQAVQKALSTFGISSGGYTIALTQHGSVGTAEVVVAAVTGVTEAALANAIAFYFEEAFGYAPAAKHPVAYEEAMRPGH